MKHIIGAAMLICFVLAILGTLTLAIAEVEGWKGALIFWLLIIGVVGWLGLACYLLT